MAEVTIYTDGAASGNPGPGGYGAVLLYTGADGKQYGKELSAGYAHTTNNRMELLAVIVALEALKNPCEVQLYTDSSYVVDAVEKGWLFRWEHTAFKNKKNPDLWVRFLHIYRQHRVKLNWVKGHAGHPLNERCDRLAVAASTGRNLPADDGYREVTSDNKLLFR